MTAARRALLAHVQTWRPYTLWYVGLVGLAGAGLAGGRADHARVAIAWATPTAGWIGAHYLGDYFDRRLDAIAKPHRPIPSGRLSPAAAVTCGVGCVAAVAALAVAGGWATTAVAALAVAGAVAYSRGLKARGLSGNLGRGALGALALVYGVLAVAPGWRWAYLPFVAAFWLHDSSSNLVGAMRDLTGDRAGGYRTVPVRRGNDVALRLSAALYVAAVAAAAVGGVTVGSLAVSTAARAGFACLLGVSAVLGGVAFAGMGPGGGAITARAALRAHEWLVCERLGFAAAVAVLGFGPTFPVALLVAALAATWSTQTRMRAGYELGPAAAAAARSPHAIPRPRGQLTGVANPPDSE